MIRSELLEHFLLGFGLAIPNNGHGRPAYLGQLGQAASEKLGDCDAELLDALYNLQTTHAALLKYVPLGGGFQPVSFETKRETSEWRDFFTNGQFNIVVLPAGRVRFEKLDEEIQQLKRSAQPFTSLQEVDDRKFARMAIDEARKSVSESDDRVHPRVGAVVVKEGQVLSVAHRGEQPGNHAEYVALEKKLSDDAVAGATVYTTLEPCTTRNQPKVPCAERIIERRVARVVIGMLDPDVRIRGCGQRKLRSAGIATDFFPSDLMAEIEDLNREFTRSCEQSVQTEVGPANVELWKEVAGLRSEIAEFKQNIELSEKKKAELENFPVDFLFDQGSPGNFSGICKNDSKRKVRVESIQVLRGDVSYDSPLTEAVKPRQTDDWVVEAGQAKTLTWVPQHDPIRLLRTLAKSSDPNFPYGTVMPLVVLVSFQVDGSRLNKRFIRQMLIQGNQILSWGP